MQHLENNITFTFSHYIPLHTVHQQEDPLHYYPPLSKQMIYFVKLLVFPVKVTATPPSLSPFLNR